MIVVIVIILTFSDQLSFDMLMHIFGRFGQTQCVLNMNCRTFSRDLTIPHLDPSHFAL